MRAPDAAPTTQLRSELEQAGGTAEPEPEPEPEPEVKVSDYKPYLTGVRISTRASDR